MGTTGRGAAEEVGRRAEREEMMLLQEMGAVCWRWRVCWAGDEGEDEGETVASRMEDAAWWRGSHEMTPSASGKHPRDIEVFTRMGNQSVADQKPFEPPHNCPIRMLVVRSPV